MTIRSVSAKEFFAAPFQRAGRAHFSTAEVESERYAAAERLGELIERREQLLFCSDEAEAAELASIEEQMSVCEATIRRFE